MCSTTTWRPCRGSTIPSAPGARYYASLRLLALVKELDPAQFTKSGLMLGLGEAPRRGAAGDGRSWSCAGVDFITLGQYLQPSRKHAPVERFAPPEEFDALATIAYAKGFLMVAASPLTRSSHHAGEDFERLRAARQVSKRPPPEPALDPLRHSLTRVLLYTPRQLFDLVGDVERYPEFVPWVTRLTTRNRRADGKGVMLADATAEVGFSIIHERFTTRVRLDEPALTIDVDPDLRPVPHPEEPLALQAARERRRS